MTEAVAQQTAFKEDGDWRRAQPSQIDPHQPWWQWYGDAQIDTLVRQAMAANQSLQQAEAQYRQAQAVLQGASASTYPTLGATASVQRSRSKNTAGVAADSTSHAWGLQASWEPDLWGRVQRSVEAAQASTQASQADLAAAQLSVQASVVNNYIQLRLADAQKDLYARTVEGYRKSLQLTQAQFRAGVVTRSDVALAQSTLASAEAQAADVTLTRNQLEHALAVLQGKTPAEFTLPSTQSVQPAPLTLRLPVMPPGLPSQLLERRPDIAGAERRMAAANAQMGVAEAAWFPRFTFSPSVGFAGLGLGPWAATPDRVWALGAAMAATLFDGGLRKAQTAQARAAFDAAAANYRQTVLLGMQDVEDNLNALRELARERAAQERAVAAAGESEKVLLNQYRAGTATYIAVVTVQAQALAASRTLLQIQAREYAASVALVKALGGGWNNAALKKP